MCNIVSVVSSVISVKHPVLIKVFFQTQFYIGNMQCWYFWLIALTTNTCAFIWTNLRSEICTSELYTEERKMNGHSLRSPFWYRLWPLNLLCKQRQELHFIHISYYRNCFCFSCWKKIHKTIETLRLLMQICKTLFDKLWIIRSISCFFLICYLTVWACACLCECVCVRMCECVNVCGEEQEEVKNENVSSRKFVYLCDYLFE